MWQLLKYFILFSSLHRCSYAKKKKGKKQELVDTYVRRAGLFTPYNLIPGDGEKYFLTSALVFQNLGYDIDILVKSDNICNSTTFLQETANSLQVKLDFNRLRVLTVKQTNNKLDFPLSVEYEVFYLLGNDKAPQIKGYGTKVNFYMCQFPIDIYYPFPQIDQVNEKLESLTSYDIVFVNSVFSQTFYGRAILPYMNCLLTSNRKIPSVNILYPPIDPFTNTITHLENQIEDQDFHIIVIGRFSTDGQNSGQNVVLDLLEQLVSKTSKKVHLNLIDTSFDLSLNYNKYVSELKFNATLKKLNVNYLTNHSFEEVSRALSKSKVLWHISGNKVDKEIKDLGILEVFGVPVVQGMSTGCIPIVLNRGGILDIVKDQINGYVVESIDEFVEHTLIISEMGQTEINAIRDAAIAQSKVFLPENFVKRLTVLTQRGILSQGFRKFAEKNIHILRKYASKSVATSSNLVAVIVEPQIHSDFEFCVRNVIHHLGSDWGVVVYYSKANKGFIHSVLKDIPNIRFLPLPHYVRDTLEYNKLLRTRGFWKSTEAKKVLIFQSDSIMLRSGINEFLEYDYIGAPWDVMRNERVFKMIKEGMLTTTVGNGGFSLRNVSSMIKMIEKFGSSVPLEMQEDMFFSKFLSSSGFSVAPPHVAYEFCNEVMIDRYGSPNHLALHASWYYLSEEQALKYLEMSLPKKIKMKKTIKKD